VTDLGGGIDELQVDLLQSVTGGLVQERLTEGHHALLGTDNRTLDHNPLLVDLTVVREAAHRRDALLGQIVGGGGTVRVLAQLLADAVDLLVDLGTVVVTVLTRARHLELHARRMPGTDTGDLAETTMGLTRQTSHTPTSHHTVDTTTLGHTDDIDHLIRREHAGNRDLLFEETSAVVHLLIDGTTVDLNLLQVGLLAVDLQQLDLGVADHADHGRVLLGAGDLLFHLGLLVLLGIAGERLLLGLVPVLVELALALVAQVLSPDGGQRTETTRGLDVRDETDAHDGRGLEDGDGLDDLLLVQLGTRFVDITDDMGHTSLVTHETGQVRGLGGIILRERFDLTPVVTGALARQETEVSVTRALELTMRHCGGGEIYCNSELYRRKRT